MYNFGYFLYKKITFSDIFSLLSTALILNLQLKQIFLTLHFSIAGLLLPTGRWYTFMYLLDLLITQQPSMRLLKKFRSSVPGPQA